MSHSPVSNSIHARPMWVWRLLLLGTSVGLFCGARGYLIYEGEHARLLSALYHAVQLFLLHMPHLEGEINMPLEIGRWVAAATSSFAFVLVLHRVFLREWQMFRLGRAKNHVIVCGLGEVGRRLAVEYRKERRLVVAIEHDARVPGVAEVERHGVVVVLGNAREERMLARVRAHHAQLVLAVCSDDDTNLATVLALQRLAVVHKSNPKDAECLLLLADPQLRTKLSSHFVKPGHAGFQIKVGGIDIPDMIARKVIEEHPLDFEGIHETDDVRVHLVLVGTGDHAFALAVKALQLCHFANRSRLLLTVVGGNAEDFRDRLQKKHPHSEPWYDVTCVSCGLEDSAQLAPAFCQVDQNQFLTVAICGDYSNGRDSMGDSQNVFLAEAVTEMINRIGQMGQAPARNQVLVRIRHNNGFTALLDSLAGSVQHSSLRAFGFIETSYSKEVLLHEKQDQLAKALAERYRKHHGGDKWENLSEEFRDSNRLAADHIAVKLRALKLREVKKKSSNDESVKHEVFQQPTTPEAPVPAEMLVLAEMEHARWCAERFLLGWKLGQPKDREERNRLKINHCLVPWEKVPSNEKDKDFEQIRAIPEVLGEIGIKIVN